MHIKSLQLKGFKSFADETEIRFSKGINCIVGPNGCGKSNVVDALKWVTGDTSSRGMRATNMKDMVFKGAMGKRAARTSEVSITISRDELLPIKENEITVTRRIKSNGDSEFLINDRKVRLKDIQELFLSIGLGHKDYVFFEQGQIDRVLRLKPEERRVLIDDAAGVASFKEKKEESLKKLNEAETNLENVRKVIDEVTKNMKNLKNQAEKAKKFQTLRDKEISLEKKLYGIEIRTIKLTKEFKEKEVEILREDRNNLEKEISTIQVNMEELRSERETLTKEIEETSKELYELEKTKKEASLKKEFNLKEIERIKEELKEIDEDELRKIERLKRVKTETAELAEEKEKFKKGYESAQMETEELTSEIEKLKEKKKNIERDIFNTKRAISEAVNRHRKIEIEKTREEEKTNSYKNQTEKLPDEIESLKKELLYYEEQKNNLREKLVETESALEKLKEEKKNLAIIKENRQEKLEKLRFTIREKEKEIISITSRIESTEKLLQDIDFGKLENSIAESGKKGKVKGYIGLIPNLIKVDEGWEKIVESYLSLFGAGIVIKTFEDIKWIKERIKGSGRVMLFCAEVSPVKSRYIEESTPLISHVRTVDTRTKDLISVLFANVFFTSSNAENLVKEYPDCVFIDKELNVYHGKGSFIGKFKGKGIFEIEKEVEELKNRKNLLQNELEELNKGLNPFILAVSEVNENISELLKRTEALKSKKFEIESKLRETERRTKNIAKEIGNVSEKLRTAKEALSGFSNRNNLYGEKLKKLIDEKIENEQKLTEKESILQELIQKIEKISSLYSEKKTKFSVLEEKLKNVKEKIIGKERAISAVKKEIDSLYWKKDKLSKKLEEATEEIKSSENILSGIDEAIGDTKKELESLEKQRGEILSFIKEREDALKNKEKELKEIQKKIKEIEIEVARLNVRDEELTEKILSIDATVEEVINLSAGIEREDEIKRELISVKEKISRIGAVNLLAIEEYDKVKERYQFIIDQEKDLIKSIKDLKEAIEKIDEEITKRFFAAFKAVNKVFRQTFKRVFGGGSARLVLTSEDPTEAGIEIEAKPPGKKHSNINLLSGGERTLVVISLLYALYSIHPAPFLVLDEIDAALDEINILRFTELLKSISEKTQVIVITHKKVTMEAADVLYGVTMEIPGISKVVGVSFALSEV